MLESTFDSMALYGDVTAATGSFMLPASGNASPTASDVTIKNLTPKLGAAPCTHGTLGVVYTFNDADHDHEGSSRYQWFIADAADGEFRPLTGITTRTVILLPEYAGKVLKCSVTPVDEYGNCPEEGTMSEASDVIAQADGNPLTDWFYEAGFGVSHHFLSNILSSSTMEAPEALWDRDAKSWNNYVGQFDVETYAANISAAGAKFVIITLRRDLSRILSASKLLTNDVPA